MIYLFLAAFLWGTSFVAGKIAYDMLDPALVIVFRLWIAMLLLLPSSWRFYQNHFAKSNVQTTSVFIKKDYYLLVILGLLTYPITFGLQFLGLDLITASLAATIIGIEPIMVVLVGYLFFKEKPSLFILALGILAFIGVSMVVGNPFNEAFDSASLLGCLLVLLSTLVVAFWLRLSKGLLAKMSAKIYTAVTLQFGTLIGTPVLLLLVKDWQINVSLQGILAIAYLGIGCSLFATWLWNKGLEVTSANNSGLVLALEPVFGVLLAVLLLGEQLTLINNLGIVLVIASAGICMLLPKKQN